MSNYLRSAARILMVVVGAVPCLVQASPIVAMYNYTLPGNIDTKGYILYAGVTLEKDSKGVDDFYKPKATNTIYFQPEIAEIVGTSFSKSGIANCDVVTKTFLDEVAVATLKNSLLASYVDNQKQTTNASVALAIAQGKCESSKKLDSTAKDEETSAGADVDTAVAAVQATSADLRKCKQLVDGNCDALQVKDRAARAVYEAKQSDLDLVHLKAARRHRSAGTNCAVVAGLQAEISSLDKTAADNEIRYQKLTDIVSKQIEILGTELGGEGTVVMTNQANKQQLELRAANPQYEFKPVEMSELQFQFTASAEDLKESVKKRNVIGITLQGAAADSDQDPTKPAPVVRGKSATVIASGSGSSSAVVSFSRIGACNSENQRTAGFKFKYNTYGYLAVDVSYDRVNVYEKLESNKTSGGFLKTETFHDLTESMKSTTNYKFAAITDDPAVDIEKMNSLARETLAKQVMQEMTDITKMQIPAMQQAAAPGQNGADALGNALGAIPNPYTQGAAVVLKTVSAIFGGSNSIETVKRTVNAHAQDRYLYTKPYTKDGQTAVAVKWLMDNVKVSKSI